MFDKSSKTEANSLSSYDFQKYLCEQLRTYADVLRVNLIETRELGVEVWFQADVEPDTYYLDNAYRAYVAAQTHEERAAIVEHWLDSMSRPLMRDADVSLDSLYPLVRHRDYFNHGTHDLDKRLDQGKQADNHPQSNSFALRPLAGDLVIALAAEAEHNLAFQSASSLHTANLDLSEAWDAAFENLRNRVSPVLEQVHPAGLLLYHDPELVWLTPSLLLLADPIQSFMADNNVSSVLTALPNLHGILLMDEGLEHSGPMLRNIMPQALAENHSQTNMIFRMERGSLTLSPVMVAPGMEGCPTAMQ